MKLTSNLCQINTMHFGVLRQKVSNAFEYVFIENKITKEFLLKQRTIRLTVQIHVDIYHLLSNVKKVTLMLQCLIAWAKN